MHNWEEFSCISGVLRRQDIMLFGLDPPYQSKPGLTTSSDFLAANQETKACLKTVWLLHCLELSSHVTDIGLIYRPSINLILQQTDSFCMGLQLQISLIFLYKIC